jgi:hypothetical protein
MTHRASNRATIHCQRGDEAVVIVFISEPSKSLGNLGDSAAECPSRWRFRREAETGEDGWLGCDFDSGHIIKNETAVKEVLGRLRRNTGNLSRR